VTPRSPRERIALASIKEALNTLIRKRLAATSIERTFVRPPRAASRSWIVVGSDAALAVVADPGDEAEVPVRSASLISPAIWSALAPITTCNDVAEGRTNPRTPR